MKSCKRCGAEKPRSDFYKHPKTKDGLMGICKECHKVGVTTNRNDNIARYREYDRERGARQSPEYLKEYRTKFPKKYAAHIAVGNAVRDGKLIKLSHCEECNSDFAVEGHHDDYNKPLEVRWLCAACHKQWHAINGEAKQ